jgi:hypothetical protein
VSGGVADSGITEPACGVDAAQAGQGDGGGMLSGNNERPLG